MIDVLQSLQESRVFIDEKLTRIDDAGSKEKEVAETGPSIILSIFVLWSCLRQISYLHRLLSFSQ